MKRVAYPFRHTNPSERVTFIAATQIGLSSRTSRISTSPSISSPRRTGFEKRIYLDEHGCPPEQIDTVSIDMSPAFIKGVSQELLNARITFDKFHVVWHANAAVDKMRRIEQRTDKSLKGLRWSLLKDRSVLKSEAAADLDALIARMTTVRTARAWLYKEQLREIL